MKSSLEKPNTSASVAEPARSSRIARVLLLALLSIALLVLVYTCTLFSLHNHYSIHMDAHRHPSSHDHPEHGHSGWTPAWVASMMRPHKCHGMHHQGHVQAESLDPKDSQGIETDNQLGKFHLERLPDLDKQGEEDEARAKFDATVIDSILHYHTKQLDVILARRAENSSLMVSPTSVVPSTSADTSSNIVIPSLSTSSSSSPTTSSSSTVTPSTSLVSSSSSSSTDQSTSSTFSTLTPSTLRQTSESTSVSQETTESSTLSLTSPTTSSTSDASTSEPTSAPVVVTVTRTGDGGSTVVMTTTQSGSTPSTGSTNRGATSGGLSKSNQIVVGVVVGVGGAIIIGIVGGLFWLRRRSANQFSSGSWTFWRKNEKDGANDLLTGELGVRDRNINQGSNF